MTFSPATIDDAQIIKETDTFQTARTELELRTANARVQELVGELLKRIPALDPKDRKAFGQSVNAVKQQVEGKFKARLLEIAKEQREAELSGPKVDVTLPGRRGRHGSFHPIRLTMTRLLDGFASLGFEVADTREVELTEYNFGKLGFPPDHPATDMQDSFFVQGGSRPVLLRTHATAVQVHEMLRRAPPMAVVTGGAVYRRDDDATHSPMFHQIDGFAVGKDLSFAHLKGVLSSFVGQVFGPEVPTRFRPSYFPFVEPGGELDMGCLLCKPWAGGDSATCRVCKGSGWIEILGCGMIHPVVMTACGHDPLEWQGFAWGMGIDRIAMLLYGISHIRLLYDNDPRFLHQFARPEVLR